MGANLVQLAARTETARHNRASRLHVWQYRVRFRNISLDAGCHLDTSRYTPPQKYEMPTTTYR